MIMSASSRRSGVFTPRPPVPSHRFAVGQAVLLTSTVGTDIARDHRFCVIATLPARDGSLQYRIRDEAENHDRVAT